MVLPIYAHNIYLYIFIYITSKLHPVEKDFDAAKASPPVKTIAIAIAIAIDDT